MDVVQLALNQYNERETTWLLAVIGLETHVMSMLVPSRTFQVYLEDLRRQLTDRLHVLDVEFNQPQTGVHDDDDDDEDDEHDSVGIELRQVAADLDRLQEHCTAVELREQAQRRKAEERQQREEQRRLEEDYQRFRQTIRYTVLVEQEVAARHAKIRAQVLREHKDEVQELLRKQRRELNVAWKIKVQDGLAEWDHAQSLASHPSQAKAWMQNVRQQERRMRRKRVAELAKEGVRPKHRRARIRVYEE
jgi:DNA mismatch repair ATPase MutS